MIANRIVPTMAAFLLISVLAGCGTTASPQVSAHQRSAGLPTGWRWESYGSVQLGVPGGWGHGTTGDPWCLSHTGTNSAGPYVGRPGAIRDIACGLAGAGGVDPSTKLVPGGTFVWFSDADPKQPAKTGQAGDRDTRIIDGVQLDVQAPKQLRQQILSTVQQANEDQNGCRSSHPLDHDRAWRPAGGTPVTGLTGVTSISACRYSARLISSVRVEGAAAAAAIAAIAAARPASGPNDPQECAADYGYGNQEILLQIKADQGERQIVLRYDGCNHHGFDDGTTIHALTRAAVTPFVSGANWVSTFQGNLSGILPAHP